MRTWRRTLFSRDTSLRDLWHNWAQTLCIALGPYIARLNFYFFSDTELTASVLKERFCVFLAAECAVSHRLIHSGLQSVAVQLDSVYKPCQRQETEIETVSDHITPSEEKMGSLHLHWAAVKREHCTWAAAKGNEDEGHRVNDRQPVTVMKATEDQPWTVRMKNGQSVQTWRR